MIHITINGKPVETKQYTSKSFYNEYIGKDLTNGYVMLMNDPTREYYKLYEIDYDRHMYDGYNWRYVNLPVEDIKKICANAEKEITSIDDLSFGDYKRIIENPNLWDKLKINADKKLLTERLDNIRKIRNEIMHFAPDSIDKEAIGVLNDTSKYLATLIKYKYPEGKEN